MFKIVLDTNFTSNSLYVDRIEISFFYHLSVFFSFLRLNNICINFKQNKTNIENNSYVFNLLVVPKLYNNLKPFTSLDNNLKKNN